MVGIYLLHFCIVLKQSVGHWHAPNVNSLITMMHTFKHPCFTVFHQGEKNEGLLNTNGDGKYLPFYGWGFQMVMFSAYEFSVNGGSTSAFWFYSKWGRGFNVFFRWWMIFKGIFQLGGFLGLFFQLVEVPTSQWQGECFFKELQ